MSTVIVGAIVLIWLIVLVPMWLRRHDADLDERSSEQFEGAMRVLARRPVTAGVDRRYVVMPRRSAATSVHVSGASAPVASHPRRERELVMPAPVVAPPQPVAPVVPASLPKPDFVAAPQISVPVSTAARRRRTLSVLAGLTVLTIVLSIGGVTPWPIQLLPELLLIAFVAQLRVSTRRQAAVVSRQRRRGAVASPAPAPVARRQAVYFEFADETVFDQSSTHVPESAASPVAEPFAATASFTPYDVFADTELFGTRASAPVVPEPEVVADPEENPARTWEPKPVPRPTYQMKPAAPGREFTYADDDEPVLEAEPAHELDLILEHRRAVND